MNTREILQKVANERIRQDTKWGVQNHGPFVWLAILLEEVGEAAKAALEGSSFKYQDELIEVAAVAVAAVESLNRGNIGLDSIVKLQKELKEARATIESLKAAPPVAPVRVTKCPECGCDIEGITCPECKNYFAVEDGERSVRKA